VADAQLAGLGRSGKLRARQEGGRVDLLRQGAESLGQVMNLLCDLRVVLDTDAVLENRDAGRLEHFARLIHAGGAQGDVIRLPLAGLPHRVGERDGLLIDAAGHPVHVRAVGPPAHLHHRLHQLPREPSCHQQSARP